ncbi:hypothetical protein Tco_1402631 [Tanacetum coccineum]
MSKKDLLRLDKELAFKLQAEEEEEERIAREKAQRIEEVNIAWDDVQAKIEADYQTELVEENLKKSKAEITQESSSKRAGEETGEVLEQESSKNQKVEEDKESEELKQCLEIVSDDVTIDATPLSIKSPTIMLKNFDREDLEVLWSIVKARFKKTEPVNYMDNLLLHHLKTMFEHYVEDNVWKNQQGLVKVLNWKLYDSCGVHCVTMQSIPFYLLVEKIYPLTNHTLHQMFNDVKLQVDYECEMAFELLRLVNKQLKEGYERIVGIKSLLEVTAAKVCVIAAKLKSVLTEPEILGLHKEQRISSFVYGLKTRSLVELLSTDLPTTYKGLMEKTYTWIKAKRFPTIEPQMIIEKALTGSIKVLLGTTTNERKRI